jgi:hypothetical protein
MLENGGKMLAYQRLVKPIAKETLIISKLRHGIREELRREKTRSNPHCP